MNERTKLGLIILQSALLVGIFGDFLLRRTPWGLNAFLWIIAVSVAMIAIDLQTTKKLWNRQTYPLFAAMIFFAATFLYRASTDLLFLNVVAIFVIWAVLTLPNLKLNARFAGISQYFLGFVWSGINLLTAPFLLVFSDVRWKNSSDKKSKILLPIIRGLVIVAPLLLIFGGLFMAADAAFEGIVKRTFNFDPSEIFSHLFLIGFISWIVAGYLRATFIGSLIPQQMSTQNNETPKVESRTKFDWRNFHVSSLPTSLSLGIIEVSIIWGLLNLLFLAFVIVQIPYLFGGFDYVNATQDLKLADYARRGFGELVFVSVLVLPLLLVGHWFLRRENKLTERIFRVLAGIQIVLLFVIMLSSAQRMIIYTGNQGYGLTLDRLYPMVLMTLLAAIFIWFAATIFSGMREKFAWGALWLSLFTLGTLNIINPEDFVVRTNFRLKQEGRNYDKYYNSNLSDDAIPSIIEILPSLSDAEKCEASNQFNRTYRELKQTFGPRNWNYSRWRA